MKHILTFLIALLPNLGLAMPNVTEEQHNKNIRMIKSYFVYMDEEEWAQKSSKLAAKLKDEINASRDEIKRNREVCKIQMKRLKDLRQQAAAREASGEQTIYDLIYATNPTQRHEPSGIIVPILMNNELAHINLNAEASTQ